MMYLDPRRSKISMIFHAIYIFIFFRIVNSFHKKKTRVKSIGFLVISVHDGKQPKIVDIYAVTILGMKRNLH